MEQAEEDDNSKESEASEKSIDLAGDVLLVWALTPYFRHLFCPVFLFFLLWLMAPMQVHPCSISWIIFYGLYEETHPINWKPKFLIWRRY